MLHEYDSQLSSSSVYSSQLGTEEEVNEIVEKVKQKTKRDRRGARVTEKEKERREVVDGLREANTSNKEMQQAMFVQSMLALQVMQKALAPQTVPPDEVSKLLEVEMGLDTLREQVSGLENAIEKTQNTLELILEKLNSQ